jgi:Carboxypeptidase regulatory-like domain
MSMPLMQSRSLVAALLAVGVATAAAAQPPQGEPGGRGGRGGGRGQGPPAGGPQRPQPRDGTGDSIATGTAIVSGIVLVAGTGAPARRARITLNAVEGGSRTALTDEEGRYAFSGLAAGRYNLSASKTGHVGVTFGQTRPGRPGTPIQLADDDKFSANLEIPRGSVVTGTVVDDYGEATPGTQVRVMRYVMQAGRRTLQQSGSGSTDDRGIYRVFGLQPGEYIVSAVPRSAGPGPDMARMQVELEAVRQQLAVRAVNQAAAATALEARAAAVQSMMAPQEEQTTGYAPVYYPGTIAPSQAMAVTLGIGEERANIDFQLQRVPLARIEGTIVNATGQPAENVQITLADASQAVPGIGTFAARADAEGRFRLANVPPGNYRMIARATVTQAGGGAAQPGGGRGAARPFGPQSNAVRLWGALDLLVEGRNLTNVILPLQQGLTLSGRIVLQGTTQQPPPDLTRIRVNITPVDPAGGSAVVQPAAGTVDATGKFTITSVVPGWYRLSGAGAGTGWFLESSVVDGQDSLDYPFEVKAGAVPQNAVVTFTDRQSQLTGRIINQRGAPAPEQTLILYPADERLWGAQSRRIRSTRPSTDGQFNFTGIPPGEYKLVAMVDVEPGAWFDPAFLQQVDAASTRVTISEGEKKVQNLQISSGG